MYGKVRGIVGQILDKYLTKPPRISDSVPTLPNPKITLKFRPYKANSASNGPYKATVKTDAQLSKYIAPALGFISPSNPSLILTTLPELADLAHTYTLLPKKPMHHPSLQTNLKNTSDAMEQEVVKTLKNALTNPIDLPRTLHHNLQRLQEWDGMVYEKRGNRLYVIEAKNRFSLLDLTRVRTKFRVSHSLSFLNVNY